RSTTIAWIENTATVQFEVDPSPLLPWLTTTSVVSEVARAQNASSVARDRRGFVVGWTEDNLDMFAGGVNDDGTMSERHFVAEKAVSGRVHGGNGTSLAVWKEFIGPDFHVKTVRLNAASEPIG